MGKQIEYDKMPKRPRAAKLAWSKLEKTHGPPKKMFFDHFLHAWVGIYKGERQLVKEED